MDTVATYRGRRLEELSKEELIEAIKVLAQYYESRLKDEKSVADMYALAHRCAFREVNP